MKFVCLSHIISQNTPSYGNRDHIFIRKNSSISNGETTNSSFWFFSNNHISTHIDVPHHFCDNGEKTHELPVEDYFFNKIQLIDIPCEKSRLIVTEDFARLNKPIQKNIELLLIRTGYEVHRGVDKYWNDNPGLGPELADFLRQNYPSLRCVGFDFISLTSWKFRTEGRESHREFLCPEAGKKPILVIEDMSLEQASGQIERIIVAPLFVEDGNGGAVTVFAELKS